MSHVVWLTSLETLTSKSNYHISHEDMKCESSLAFVSKGEYRLICTMSVKQRLVTRVSLVPKDDQEEVEQELKEQKD